MTYYSSSQFVWSYPLGRVPSRHQRVYEISKDNVFAWTDSTIVLSWLSENPRQFKMFVGNRVPTILVCRQSLTSFLPVVSAMWQAWTTLLIRNQEECFLWNSWSMNCGGVVYTGFAKEVLNGFVSLNLRLVLSRQKKVRSPCLGLSLNDLCCQSWKQLQASLTLFVSLPGLGDSPTIVAEMTVVSVVSCPSMSWLMPKGIGLPRPNIPPSWTSCCRSEWVFCFPQNIICCLCILCSTSMA